MYFLNQTVLYPNIHIPTTLEYVGCLLRKVLHANICAYKGICIPVSLYTMDKAHATARHLTLWFPVCICTASQAMTMTSLDRPCQKQ